MKNKKIFFLIVTFSLVLISFLHMHHSKLNHRISSEISNKQVAPVVDSYQEKTKNDQQAMLTPILLEHTPQTKALAAARIVQSLGRKVLLNQVDKNLMKTALLSPDLQKWIMEKLSNTELLSSDNTDKRLHILDIVYEGLKFKDNEVQRKYRQLAFKLLDEDIPSEVNQDRLKREQYVGDRVELAMIITKIDKNAASEVSSEAKGYFRSAEKIAPMYRVSL